MGKYTKFIL